MQFLTIAEDIGKDAVVPRQERRRAVLNIHFTVQVL